MLVILPVGCALLALSAISWHMLFQIECTLQERFLSLPVLEHPNSPPILPSGDSHHSRVKRVVGDPHTLHVCLYFVFIKSWTGPVLFALGMCSFFWLPFFLCQRLSICAVFRWLTEIERTLTSLLFGCH
jgi:hypothetical protein